MITLTETDLYQTIPEADVKQLTARQITDGADPIGAAIADALDTVKMYVNPSILPDNALRKIWRILAVAQLYIAVTTLPEKRKAEQDWAIKTLCEIRDGKFHGLLLDAEQTTPAETDAGQELAGGGSWGAADESGTFRIA